MIYDLFIKLASSSVLCALFRKNHQFQIFALFSRQRITNSFIMPHLTSGHHYFISEYRLINQKLKIIPICPLNIVKTLWKLRKLPVTFYFLLQHKGIEIWARPITPVYQNYYSYAIAFLNRRTDGTPSDVSVTLKELGLQYPGGYRVEV